MTVTAQVFTPEEQARLHALAEKAKAERQRLGLPEPVAPPLDRDRFITPPRMIEVPTWHVGPSVTTTSCGIYGSTILCDSY
jgi:hypothetical protein